MGIPSYFSHIIRKYTKILRNYQYFIKNNQPFTHLYMDCNSIIYDAYYSISAEYHVDKEELFEEKIIREVATSIENYISIISPTDVVYISFDGVAPLAKMEQQRTRRYKTNFMSNINYGAISTTCHILKIINFRYFLYAWC